MYPFKFCFISPAGNQSWSEGSLKWAEFEVPLCPPGPLLFLGDSDRKNTKNNNNKKTLPVWTLCWSPLRSAKGRGRARVGTNTGEPAEISHLTLCFHILLTNNDWVTMHLICHWIKMQSQLQVFLKVCVYQLCTSRVRFLPRTALAHSDRMESIIFHFLTIDPQVELGLHFDKAIQANKWAFI